MILLIYPKNVDGISFNDATFTSSNLHKKPSITLLSTLFKLDLPLIDQKKMNEQPIGEFLWQGICCYMCIKDFLPK